MRAAAMWMSGMTLLALAGAAAAGEPAVTAAPDGWTGSGELGFASATGNSRASNLNARLAVGLDQDRWHHAASAFYLKSRGEVDADRDLDGQIEEYMEDTANRYGAQLSSAYDLSPRSYLIGAARYDHDEFATYLWQGTASFSYGYRWFDNERLRLLTEVGPGYRRSHNAGTGEVKSDAIGRGMVDVAYALTGNTWLTDTLLVESGRLNTYVQNDLGLKVGMNDRLALKLGYQVRHNTDAEPGFKKTDTVTTLNLVYDVK